MVSNELSILYDVIANEVFVSATAEHITPSGTHIKKDDGWLFDFRRVMLEPDFLHHTATLLQRTMPHPIQICGLEVAAIPLVAGIVAHAKRDGNPIHGFFIRKSRKKDGLMRMIEGSVQPGVPIVLVDDILNSGKSFIRQIEVLEGLGHTVTAVWCILRFRDLDFYEYFHKKNIAIHSLFTLDDFSGALPVKNIVARGPIPQHRPPIQRVWRFASAEPNFAYVNPKSRPCIDASSIYFGVDSGYMCALSQDNGALVWRYKVGYHAKGKSIFSSPVLGTVTKENDTVFFGAYDGNTYALDAATGARRWVNFDADWVGSSPAVAPDLGLLFIGTEHGITKKRGGIMALDIHTGKKVWGVDMPTYTHSSPLYVPGGLLTSPTVLIGSNDGVARLFNAKTGALVWEYASGTSSEQELAAGFSAYDIKDSFAYSSAVNAVYFGNQNGDFFALNKKTGEKIWQAKAEFAFWSRPLLVGEKIVASSLDKFVYCWDTATGKEIWRWHAGARVFCAPSLWEEPQRDGTSVQRILVGSNTGRLTALDPETGREVWFVTLPERIVNAPVYNAKTRTLFVPTFANEVYAFTVTPSSPV